MQSVIRFWLLSGAALACFIAVFRLQDLPIPYLDQVVIQSEQTTVDDHFTISVTVNGSPFQISISKSFSQQYENYLVTKSKTFCEENAATLQLLPIEPVKEETGEVPSAAERSTADARSTLLDSAPYIQCVEILKNHLLKEVVANFPLTNTEPLKSTDTIEKPKAVTYLNQDSLTTQQLTSPLIVTIKIPIKNGKVYKATFDALSSSPHDVSKTFCEQNQVELGLGSEDVTQCVKNVELYIVEQLKALDTSHLAGAAKGDVEDSAMASPETVDRMEAEVASDGTNAVSEETVPAIDTDASPQDTAVAVVREELVDEE